MENLNKLKIQLSEAKSELESITIKKHGSVPWKPGVLDQYESDSYSYEEYTDTSKAYKLKERIKYLEEQIKTYPERAKNEREVQLRASRDTYEYVSGGKKQETTNPAIAARYDAQKRFFEMNKLQRAMVSLNGQKRKFRKLWLDAVTPDKKTQEQVAEELGKLFR